MTALDKLADWIKGVEARVHRHDQRLTQIETILEVKVPQGGPRDFADVFAAVLDDMPPPSKTEEPESVPDVLIESDYVVDAYGEERLVEAVPLRLLLIVNRRIAFDYSTEADGTLADTAGEIRGLARMFAHLDPAEAIGRAATVGVTEVVSWGEGERNRLEQELSAASQMRNVYRELLRGIGTNEAAMQTLDTGYAADGRGGSLGGQLRALVGSPLPTYPLPSRPPTARVEVPGPEYRVPYACTVTNLRVAGGDTSYVELFRNGHPTGLCAVPPGAASAAVGADEGDKLTVIGRRMGEPWGFEITPRKEEA